MRCARHRYISVTGLPNVIQVFDDVERGKLKDIDFLECYACWAGCANGNLTVDNVYVSQAKLQTLMVGLPPTDADDGGRGGASLPACGLLTGAPVRAARARQRGRPARARAARQGGGGGGALAPGYDCGLCGAPSCGVLARDVAGGQAAASDCVILSRQRLEELRRNHPRSAT